MPALIKAKETGQTNKSFYMEKYSNVLQSVYTVDDPFPKKLYGTIGFQLGDGIRCFESEAQNTELSLEVAKIQFSLSGL